MAAAPSVRGAGPGAEAAAPEGAGRAPEEELPPLEADEVRKRLENSERQLRNRRKVLIRGLPADVSNQDIHELLKDYELKYCFVDKHKGTAFLTLQDASQASSAVQQLQGRALRGHHLLLQLQPSEAVLCVANLPRLLSQQRFQELLKPFGMMERCFLVYSPTTGHSKGYGFVEFLKKDSAVRARSELLGKRLGTRSLFVHWAEAELSPQRLHSRCLCVDRLPRGFGDTQGLRRMAAATCEPEFCQLAVGQDGQLKGFAVLEFPSPEGAERVQQALDGAALAGTHIRVSFCAPGPPGPSMLAALVAAQAMAQNRGKGLLPEPNLLQILGSLGNPSLQLLLNPLLHGSKQGILGAAPALPLVANPAHYTALLRLLQKPGILGDSPLSSQPLGEIPAGAALAGDGPKTSGKSQNFTPGNPKIGQGQVSLLGEPPKSWRVPLNPYLNLQSLLPPPGPAAGRGFQVNPGALPQDLGSPKFGIFPPNREPGAAQGRNKVSSSSSSSSSSLGTLGSPFFWGSPRSNFSSGLRAGLRQTQLGKKFSLPPSSEPSPALVPPSSHLKTPITRPKRAFSQLLPSPEPSPEGSYVGQHSQGLGGHYADSYLKRKRIF